MAILFWLVILCSLAIWAGLSTDSTPSAHEQMLGIASLVLIVALVILSAKVLRKWALIRATAKCLPLEMTRCEPSEPEDRWRATEAILTRFGITGHATVKSAGPMAISLESGSAKSFFKSGEYAADHKRAEDRSYVLRRLVLRLWFDAFEALVGETKSIDVAVEKATQALQHWQEEQQIARRDRINVSNLPNLAKALGLKSVVNSKAGPAQVGKRRWLSLDSLSLWCAIHLFDYTQYLRYGSVITGSGMRDRWIEFRGRQAFEVMRMYQAWNALRLSDYLSKERL